MLNKPETATGALAHGATTAQPARQYINPRSAANAAAANQPPFSGAVLAGNTLYISGMLGTGDSAETAAT